MPGKLKLAESIASSPGGDIVRCGSWAASSSDGPVAAAVRSLTGSHVARAVAIIPSGQLVAPLTTAPLHPASATLANAKHSIVRFMQRTLRDRLRGEAAERWT